MFILVHACGRACIRIYDVYIAASILSGCIITLCVQYVCVYMWQWTAHLAKPQLQPYCSHSSSADKEVSLHTHVQTHIHASLYSGRLVHTTMHIHTVHACIQQAHAYNIKCAHTHTQMNTQNRHRNMLYEYIDTNKHM